MSVYAFRHSWYFCLFLTVFFQHYLQLRKEICDSVVGNNQSDSIIQSMSVLKRILGADNIFTVRVTKNMDRRRLDPSNPSV